MKSPSRKSRRFELWLVSIKQKSVTSEVTAENLFIPNDMVDPKSISSKELRVLRRYQEMTSSALYVATYTRYDIAYLSRHARPT